MRNSACKGTIRKAARQIYNEAGANPPNMNQASDLIKRQISASRSRVREVLREGEFARQRRGPGRKAKRRPIQLTTVQEIPQRFERGSSA
jgi:hypothetical protein